MGGNSHRPGAEKIFSKGVDKCEFMVYNKSIN